MRTHSNVARHRRKKRIMKRAKGYRGGRSKLLRTAIEAVHSAGKDAYYGRRIKKRDYRKLWIIRLNAALEPLGISYSKFIHGLTQAKIEINRKWLSELAIQDHGAFKQIVEQAKAAAV